MSMTVSGQRTWTVDTAGQRILAPSYMMQTIIVEEENAITIIDPDSEAEKKKLFDAKQAHEYHACAMNLTDDQTVKHKIMELW